MIFCQLDDSFLGLAIYSLNLYYFVYLYFVINSFFVVYIIITAVIVYIFFYINFTHNIVVVENLFFSVTDAHTFIFIIEINSNCNVQFINFLMITIMANFKFSLICIYPPWFSHRIHLIILYFCYFDGILVWLFFISKVFIVIVIFPFIVNYYHNYRSLVYFSIFHFVFVYSYSYTFIWKYYFFQKLWSVKVFLFLALENCYVINFLFVDVDLVEPVVYLTLNFLFLLFYVYIDIKIVFYSFHLNRFLILIYFFINNSL